MLLFIITVIITLCMGALAISTNFDCGGITAIAFLVLTIFMLYIIIGENSCAASHFAQYQQEHDILQYQVDNNLYDNYIDNGKSDLYQKVMNYNKMVVSGRELNDNIWFGWFYADYYDDLELIELP